MQKSHAKLQLVRPPADPLPPVLIPVPALAAASSLVNPPVWPPEPGYPRAVASVLAAFRPRFQAAQEETAAAPGLLEELLSYSLERRELLARNSRRFRSLALCGLLLDQGSFEVSEDHPAEGERLANLCLGARGRPGRRLVWRAAARRHPVTLLVPGQRRPGCDGKSARRRRSFMDGRGSSPAGDSRSPGARVLDGLQGPPAADAAPEPRVGGPVPQHPAGFPVGRQGAPRRRVGPRARPAGGAVALEVSLPLDGRRMGNTSDRRHR